ncbi:MAG: MBOAT family protein [Butyrivibrio sp.]|nr:MBOAT family protein [Butyrivibrio sp.]
MLFNSFIFIFIFLPLTLIGWYALNHYRRYETAKFFLTAMSLWFYGYFNLSYLAIIIVSIAANYLLSLLLTLDKNALWARIKRRFCLFAGIIFNLGLLFYFKYYDFFIENINAVFHADFTLKNILLPLGISFFTFQQLSYIIDRCMDRAGHYPLITYAAYVTFFPQLIAGPIVLHTEMIPQLENVANRRFNARSFAQGIILFVLGLGKKVLIADVLALVANYGFEQVYYLDAVSALLVILAYAFELYFDFSGYSDMAMGLGRMFNIILPANFNSPYKSCSFKEAWQRWHITLTRFFTTYVYIPLGGNRKGRLRTIINILIVFLLSGLWHGAAWTFVVWGVLHGVLVAWDNLGIVGVKGREEKRPSKYHIPAWLGWLVTFTVFNLLWVFFRSENLPDAVQMFKNLAGFKYTGKVFDIAAKMDIAEFYIVKKALQVIAPNMINYAFVLLLVFYLLLSFFLIFRKNAREIAEDGILSSGKCWGICIIFIWCIISLSQVSTFLYFNF